MAGVAAVAAVVTAATSVGLGIANYEAAQGQADAAKSLADQQAAQLKQQQDEAGALAAAQATGGATFGRDTNLAATGLGFDKGGKGPNTGFGRAQLTGGNA